MMLDVVKARTQLFFRDAKHARKFVLHIAYFRGVAESILNLLSCKLRTRVAANRIFLCRCAEGSREIPTWSRSSRPIPAASRQYRIACAGKPAECLKRLKRSSSAAAIKLAIFNDRRRRVAVIRVDSENVHPHLSA